MNAVDELAQAISGLGESNQTVAAALVQLGNAVAAGYRAGIRDQTKTNNWRKMHGMPMRRRGGRRWR